MSREFLTIFLLKKFDLGFYEQAKTILRTFLFSRDAKNVCPCRQRLRQHTGNYFTFEKLKNEQKSNNKCNLTLLENFEGFSQILKEQSAKKGNFMCLHIQ